MCWAGTYIWGSVYTPTNSWPWYGGRRAEKDGKTQRQIGTALKFDGVKPTYKFVGAKIGEHTTEILKQIGYSDETITELTEKGALE